MNENYITMKNKFIFIPIIQPTETVINFSYVAYLVLTADMECLNETEICPEDKTWIKVDREYLLKKGKEKYRDKLVPKFLHEDLKSGKCEYVILDYSLEGYHRVNWDYISDIFGIKKNKIFWLTSVCNTSKMNSESDVTVMFSNYWEKFTADIIIRNNNNLVYEKGIKQQLEDISNLKIRKYHGLNYNRRPHEHRIYLLSKLKSLGLIDKTSYSWGGFHLGEGTFKESRTTPEGVWNRATERKCLEGEEDFNAVKWLLASPKKQFPNEDLCINQADNIQFDHIKECYFQIISETIALDTHPYVFLSEKTYKTFMSGMPFVIWGLTGSVNQLRKMGYSTFDEWINHDYDNYVDIDERFNALVKEIKRLYAIPPQQWSIMLKEMLPEIEKNLEYIRTYHKNLLQARSLSPWIPNKYDTINILNNGKESHANYKANLYISSDIDR
jgi:hypothetical protein